MTDRLTKQQLKHDPLMDRTAETADFITSHARSIVIGVVALVVVAAGITFFRASSSRADENAAAVLADARIDYSRGALEPAAARLDDLLRNMGGTRAGKQGLLLYGHVRYDQGRYAEAETYYRDALGHFGDDPLFGPAARRGLAASLENQDKFLEAAAVYQELADESGGEPTIRAGFLLDVARNQHLGGKTDAAMAIYESLADSREAPGPARVAKLRLAELTPVAVAVP